jgi:hypothetical protein
MAVVIKYFCDCCGEEIKELSNAAVICIKSQYHIDGSYSAELKYCLDCWRKFRNSINESKALVNKQLTESYKSLDARVTELEKVIYNKKE